MDSAVGYLAMFWGNASRHCRGGVIADLPDSLLEQWANWRGEAGVFARFVREHHASDGQINDWDEYNGRLDARRETDRKRKAAERTSAGRPQDVQQTSRRVRNDTRRVTTREGAAAALAVLPPSNGADKPTKRPSRKPAVASAPNWLGPVFDKWAQYHGGMPPRQAQGQLMHGLSKIYQGGQTAEQMAERFGIWLSIKASEKHRYVEDFTSCYGDFDPVKCADSEYLSHLIDQHGYSATPRAS